MRTASLFATSLFAGCMAAAESAHVRVRPIHSVTTGFGAEIEISDDIVAHALPAEYVLQVVNAINRHHVVVFRGLGARLNMSSHVMFAKQLGHVDVETSSPPSYVNQDVHLSEDLETRKSVDKAATCVDVKSNTTCRCGCSSSMWLQDSIRGVRARQIASNEPVEVFKVVTSPEDVLSFGEGWHTDLTFYEDPPTHAVLVGRDLPPQGLGKTSFFSSARCYDLLPSQIKEAIEDLWSVHTDKVDHRAVHPLVRRQADGRRVLYVNRQMSRQIVESREGSYVEMEGGQELLQALFDHIGAQCGSSETLEVEWHPDDLVIWDEVATQHSATHDYTGYRREMHRVLLNGMHHS